MRVRPAPAVAPPGGRRAAGPRRRPRLWWPRSLTARTTLAAALIAAVLFTGAAWKIRQVTYNQRLSESTTVADNEAGLLIAQVTAGDTQDRSAEQAEGPFPYELTSSAGLIGSSDQMKPFETGGHAWMALPVPGPYLPDYQFRVTFPAAADSPLAGRSVLVISQNFLLADPSSPLIPARLRQSPPDSKICAYVFITTASAQAAVDELDRRVLYPGVPAAVLLVAGIACLATRRALRPVEAIRARTAAVTATDPRERVTVPRTGDEIARLAETINDTLERLDGSVRTLRGFVADAAHELRSPLSALLATLEVAEAYPDRADWPDTVATARRQARRVQILTDDLLLLARLDAQVDGADADTDPGAGAVEVDLAVLAFDTAADYRVRPDGAVAIVCDTGETAGTAGAAETALVLGNPGRLERVVRNLLDNAVRHASTCVSVAVHVGGGRVELIVQDDGPGIAPQDRERVFERFTRLDDARSRDTGGTGLGLAIAREIVEHYGGTLRVADGDAGARLVASIPRAPARPGVSSAQPSALGGIRS